MAAADNDEENKLGQIQEMQGQEDTKLQIGGIQQQLKDLIANTEKELEMFGKIHDDIIRVDKQQQAELDKVKAQMAGLQGNRGQPGAADEKDEEMKLAAIGKMQKYEELKLKMGGIQQQTKDLITNTEKQLEFFRNIHNDIIRVDKAQQEEIDMLKAKLASMALRMPNNFMLLLLLLFILSFETLF